MERVLRANGLRPFDVELLPTHGGSLRLFCAHEAASHQETQGLKDLRAREQAANLDKLSGYEGFTARVEAVRADDIARAPECEQLVEGVVGIGLAGVGDEQLLEGLARGGGGRGSG